MSPRTQPYHDPLHHPERPHRFLTSASSNRDAEPDRKVGGTRAYLSIEPSKSMFLLHNLPLDEIKIPDRGARCRSRDPTKISHPSTSSPQTRGPGAVKQQPARRVDRLSNAFLSPIVIAADPFLGNCAPNLLSLFPSLALHSPEDFTCRQQGPCTRSTPPPLMRHPRVF